MWLRGKARVCEASPPLAATPLAPRPPLAALVRRWRFHSSNSEFRIAASMGNKHSGSSSGAAGAVGAASSSSSAARSSSSAAARPSSAAAFRDVYSDLPSLQADLRRAGLEASNLIFGIDATKSNTYTGARSFGGRNLHDVSGPINPYQQAMSILAKTLETFDEDNLIPAYMFGAAGAGDHSVVSLLPGERPCVGIEQVLEAYSQVIPHVRVSAGVVGVDAPASLRAPTPTPPPSSIQRLPSCLLLQLAGPTSFAPIIRKAIEITVASGNQYHVLVIIADGQLSRSPDLPPGELSPQEEDTVAAVQEASRHPLSIIVVSVAQAQRGCAATLIGALRAAHRCRRHVHAATSSHVGAPAGGRRRRRRSLG